MPMTLEWPKIIQVIAKAKCVADIIREKFIFSSIKNIGWELECISTILIYNLRIVVYNIVDKN